MSRRAGGLGIGRQRFTDGEALVIADALFAASAAAVAAGEQELAQLRAAAERGGHRVGVPALAVFDDARVLERAACAVMATGPAVVVPPVTTTFRTLLEETRRQTEEAHQAEAAATDAAVTAALTEGMTQPGGDA